MIIRRYKKWAPLVVPILITALKDSDIDTVKGALHTLRLSTIEHTLARNWDYTENYIMALFEAFDNFDRVFLHQDDADCIAFCSKSCSIGYFFAGEVSQSQSLGEECG
jgi:hypothetical protein